MDCEQESVLSYRFRWKVCETLAISQRMGSTRFLTRSKMYLLTCSELRVTPKTVQFQSEIKIFIYILYALSVFRL